MMIDFGTAFHESYTAKMFYTKNTFFMPKWQEKKNGIIVVQAYMEERQEYKT
jgi:hypothetical protein